MAETSTRHTKALLLHELLLNQLVNLGSDGSVIEPSDYLVEKTGDEQALRDVFWDAARKQVEELVFVQLTRSGAVAALHVVG